MDSNTRPNEAPPQVYPQYAPMADEIDLLDILRILIRRKWLILGITVLCTALAVGAALLLPREYRAKVIMLPPLAETIEQLNVPNIKEGSNPYFFKVESQEVYHGLIENLQSNRLQRQFFDDNELAPLLLKKNDNRSEDVIFREEFSEKLVVGGIKNNKGAREFVTITLAGQSPEQITDWLNSFVQLADKKTIMAQTQSFAMKVQRVKDSVSQRIESLRSVEKSRRLDLMARLEEAVTVAEKLGWAEQYSHLGIQYEQAKMDAINMSFSLQNVPLYLRGSKALQAEVTVLKQRENDDPFIPELRGLQEQFNFLSSVKQDADSVHAMRLDRPAIADDRPIKPKRKLIVVLGFVLGLLLSVFVAFISNMIIRTKQSCV